jgi:hypothetical protein
MRKLVKTSLFLCGLAVLVASILILPTNPAPNKTLAWIHPPTVLAAAPSPQTEWGRPPLALLMPGLGIRAYWLSNNCTLYAAPNGNDNNSGTSPSSPMTLQGAANATSPGSVVCLLGGRYELTATWGIAIGGTSGAYITYQAYGDGPAYIVWINKNTTSPGNPMIQVVGSYNGVTYSGPQYIAFQGLHLVDEYKTSVAGFQCLDSKNLTFVGNTIINTGGAGISTIGCDYVISDHNLIYHNGYQTASGYSNTSGISYNTIPFADSYTGIHNTISNNIIVGEYDDSQSHTDGNGIILDRPYGTNTSTPPTLVVNNIVYGNGGSCVKIFSQTAGLYITNAWVVNNTCHVNNLDTNQSAHGAVAAQVVSDSYFLNNIVYLLSSGGTSLNGTYAFDQEPSSTSDTNLTYDNNLFYGASSCCHQFSATSTWSGGINADPQFMLAPYFYPSITSPYDSQYNVARPPLPLRPTYRQANICSTTLSSLWIPTCDIDAGFALASTSPGYGNIGTDPTTLTSDPNIQADLQTYVYVDINGNPRGGSTGKWDLGAYQH